MCMYVHTCVRVSVCTCVCVYLCVSRYISLCTGVYMQVLRVAVSASLGVELSFEESAERVYAAMMKVCVYAVCVFVCACGCVRIQFGSTHPTHISPHGPHPPSSPSSTQHGPHWALFNMASLYWRVSGDPQNTVECLRRAIHFAPAEAKDVGYIGLASVLHRYGYLSDAVVVARAALDITGGTVGLGRRVT